MNGLEAPLSLLVLKTKQLKMVADLEIAMPSENLIAFGTIWQRKSHCQIDNSSFSC